MEAANGPTTPEVNAVFKASDITVIPDILSSAGGVVDSYFEWVQGLQHYFWQLSEVHDKLERAMTNAFGEVLETSESWSVSLREAALILAVQRVTEAIKLRGVYP